MGQLKDRGDATATQHYRWHRKRFVKGSLAGFATHDVIELLLTLAIPCADARWIDCGLMVLQYRLERVDAAGRLFDATVHSSQRVRDDRAVGTRHCREY